MLYVGLFDDDARAVSLRRVAGEDRGDRHTRPHRVARLDGDDEPDGRIDLVLNLGAPPAKLSKADWKPYAQIKKMLHNEQKLAKENAETNGWNVTEETAAVTERFCAAVKTR